MPANKYALLRYRIIDDCLTNKARKFPTKEDLQYACEQALYGSSGERVSVSTIEKDMWAMKNESELGYYAPIAYSKLEKGYYYTDPEYTIKEISLSEENHVALLFYWQQLSGSALQDGTAGAFSSWLGPSAKPLEHHPSTAEDSMAASSRFYCHDGLVIELLSSGMMASVTVSGTAATEQ